MTIKGTKRINTEVEIQIDLSTPKFYKANLYRQRVTEEFIMNVYRSSASVTTQEAKNLPKSYYNDLILEATEGEEITEEEFYEALSENMDKINSLAGTNVPTLQLQDK